MAAGSRIKTPADGRRLAPLPAKQRTNIKNTPKDTLGHIHYINNPRSYHLVLVNGSIMTNIRGLFTVTSRGDELCRSAYD